MNKTTLTIERLKAQGTYLGYSEQRKAYIYTYNNRTFMWNGAGLKEHLKTEGTL